MYSALFEDVLIGIIKHGEIYEIVAVVQIITIVLATSGLGTIIGSLIAYLLQYQIECCENAYNLCKLKVLLNIVIFWFRLSDVHLLKISNSQLWILRQTFHQFNRILLQFFIFFLYQLSNDS